MLEKSLKLKNNFTVIEINPKKKKEKISNHYSIVNDKTMMKNTGQNNGHIKMEHCFKSNSKFITSNKSNGFVDAIYLA